VFISIGPIQSLIDISKFVLYKSTYFEV